MSENTEIPVRMRGARGRFLKGPLKDGTDGPSKGQNKGPSQGQNKGPSQGQTDDASASEASRAPSAASLFRSVGGSDADVDFESTGFASDSAMSVDSRPTRKRAFLKVRSEASSDSANRKKKTKKAKAKGSKTPKIAPVGTHDVGLADAESHLSLLNRVQLQRDLEEEVQIKEKRRAGYLKMKYSNFSMEELERMAQEDEEQILQIASKSSNIKGIYQKSLKCRAGSMRGIVRELTQRSATDETRELQARVDRLQAEINQLKSKLAETTTRPAQVGQEKAVEASSNLEEIIRKIVLEERAFTRACLAGIEDRLLPEKRVRPPLAADKRRAPGPSSQGGPTPGLSSQEESTPGPSFSGEPVPGPSSRRVPSPQREDAFLPATAPSNTWTKVVKKGKNKKAVATPASAAPLRSSQTTGKGKGVGKKSAPKPSATAAPAAKGAPAGARKRLSPPKTAAVVVTLTTEATERGETYLSVLQRARANADPSQLGIEKIACRRTQTGARIFEFSGAQGGTNADLFAAKLQEVIADSAKVVRPVKTAALEVVDLDDSVTREEVVAKVAAMGGCDVAAVKGRDIRPGRGGMGTMRIECPITAAEAVLAKGRLLIGFSSSVVRALGEQPLRCYKCFAIGHTRALCPSSIDRTDCCYRCGQEGHKSASCKASTPRCAVCAASGRPAGHVMMGRNCNPPPKKGKAQVPTRPVASAAVPVAGTSAAAEENTMSE